jgi:hypothetical protein
MLAVIQYMQFYLFTFFVGPVGIVAPWHTNALAVVLIAGSSREEEAVRQCVCFSNVSRSRSRSRSRKETSPQQIGKTKIANVAAKEEAEIEKKQHHSK